MAKKPSQTSIWKNAAKEKLKDIRSIATCHKGADLFELMDLLPRARNYKTTKGRSSTWLSVFQERILVLMGKLGKVEYSTGRSFVMLKPNLKMGQNESGKAQYAMLVEKYGKTWAEENVSIVERHYPDVTVEVFQYKTSEDLEATKQVISAHVDVEYDFVGKGTTQKELEWTETMGNKITVEISDIPARFKKGKARKGK